MDQNRRTERPDALDQVEKLANLRAFGNHCMKMIFPAHLFATKLLELVDQAAAIEMRLIR